MFRAAIAVSAGIYGLCQRYGPSNIVVRKVRTRRGLKWGIPAMGVGLVYLLAASICIEIMADNNVHWLAPVALLFTWSGLKIVLLGPISLIWLARARYGERRVDGARAVGVREPLHGTHPQGARPWTNIGQNQEFGYDPHPREQCHKGHCPHCYYASRGYRP